MKCSFCGADNDIGASFCKVCQKPLGNNNVGSENNNISSENEEIRKSYFTTHSNVQQQNNDHGLESNPPLDNLGNVNLNQSNDDLMQQPTVMLSQEQINNHGNIENETKKKKNNKPLIIGIICAVIIFVIGLVVGLIFLLKPSPSKIFKTSTNKLFDALEQNLNIQSNGFYNVNFDITPIINLSDVPTEANELIDMLNSLKINFSSWADLENNKLDLKLGLDYKDNLMIDFEMLYDEYAYLLSENLLSPPIKAECEECDQIFKNSKTTIDDSKTILAAYNEALNVALKDSYFEKDKQKITLNGKSYDATISKIKLDTTRVNEISKSIYETLSKNSEFIKAYAKIVQTDESTVKNMLENGTNSTTVDDAEEIEMILYTTGLKNDFLMFEIKDNEVSIEIHNGSKDNEYVLNVSYQGDSLGFKINYNMTSDRNVKEPDVSDAKEAQEITSYDLQDALNKILDSEGYKAFNDDFKAFSGYDFDDFINLMMGQSQESTFDGTFRGSGQITSDFFDESEFEFYY